MQCFSADNSALKLNKETLWWQISLKDELCVCALTSLPRTLRYEECGRVAAGDVCCLQAPVTRSVLQRVDLRYDALWVDGCLISHVVSHDSDLMFAA